MSGSQPLPYLDIADWNAPADGGLMSMGDRIKEAMERKGLSQTELADMLDIRPHVMWRYVHNESKPRAERLHQLAAALGVDPAWLLTGESAEDVEREHQGPEHPAFVEFKEGVGAAMDATPEELDELRREYDFDGGPSVEYYAFFLRAIRARKK